MSREWSGEQLEFFAWGAHGRGHLVGRARAGTGKSTTAVEMLNHMPERKILVAAFNKDIAVELEGKVQNPRAEVKTLNSLGFAFVRRNWHVKLDVDARGDQLVQAVAPDAPRQIARLIARLNGKAREIDPFIVDLVVPCDHEKHLPGRETCPACMLPALERVEGIAVEFDLLPEKEWESEGWGVSSVVEAAVQAMVVAKLPTKVIDFADQIFLPLVNRWVRPWYDAVIIDEAQDMTVAQLALAQGACKRGGRIAVIGDDRQAIYGFRGADSGSLDRLKQELGALELPLTTTYRCPRRVVELASKIVPDYKAAPHAPDGEVLRVGKEQMLATAREGDFIISRTNAPLVKVCMALLKQGTRARIKGREIGRGLLALVRKLRPSSLPDLVTKLGRWVESETERAKKRLSEDAAAERAQFVMDQAEIVHALLDGAVTVADLETRMETLFADDAQKQAVMCSTVHRAKGLEADRVFLLDGTFRKGKPEEDNVRYVAITRAKQALVWVTGFEKERREEEPA